MMIPYEVFFEISRLDAQYWACADKRTETLPSSLFMQDGTLVLGTLELAGREAISRFFEDRERQNTESKRITRHVASTLQIVTTARDQWTGHSVVVVFAGSGSTPVPSDIPSTIADVSDVFVRDASGAILLQSRLIKPVFVGAAAASFAR